MTLAAARLQAADTCATGCRGLAGTDCNDGQARQAACRCPLAAQAVVGNGIARRHPPFAIRHPREAQRLVARVSTAVAALSDSARK